MIPYRAAVASSMASEPAAAMLNAAAAVAAYPMINALRAPSRSVMAPMNGPSTIGGAAWHTIVSETAYGLAPN